MALSADASDEQLQSSVSSVPLSKTKSKLSSSKSFMALVSILSLCGHLSDAYTRNVNAGDAMVTRLVHLFRETRVSTADHQNSRIGVGADGRNLVLELEEAGVPLEVRGLRAGVALVPVRVVSVLRHVWSIKVELHCSKLGPPYSALIPPVSYTHLRAHETPEHLVCRLLLEKKKKQTEQ
eukprot:TRINITY_DN7038_c0_g1_i11.p1 TRINITY_DN7038_c0_g1~~TRINITY_DN7038_c0_g1_i11.p1  ORF type:complete len:180 (+),score=20.82 TRINITY_DN7038_c0_g1_i11:417-956(+)